VEEARVVPHEEVRGLERLTGPREATVETAEPGRRPHPVLEPEAAELDPIHELEEEPEAPAGLVPDGAVVLRRPQPAPGEEVPVDAELSVPPGGEVVLGEPGGAEVLEEELDLPGGPELQGQHLQAEGGLAAEGGPADAAEGGEAARETTVELGLLLIGEAGRL
jgi:hypothetical protein